MPKNIDDIVPSGRRSIRDIPLPERRKATRRVEDKKAVEPVPVRKATKAEAEEIEREVEAGELELPRMSPMRRERRSTSWSKRSTWIGVAIAVIVLAFALFSIFRSATLAYTPKTLPITFAGDTLNAYKTGGDGVLLFSVVKLSDTEGKSVPATGETQVSRKATGTIIVYNNASAAPQTLIKNTRFQATDGHVYRVGTDISIPGKTASGPGSLEITVTADQPGAEYNIGLSDFTLPGLKGDPRFQTIYARSKTTMTGGFVGSEKGVSDADLASARTALTADLKDKLQKAALAQVPADFILFPTLSNIVYTDLAQSSSTDKTVNVNEKGDFYGVIFKKTDLDAYIAAKKLTLPPNQSATIEGLDGVTFAFAGTPPADLLNASQISFTATGSATAVMVVDENALKQDLMGVKKSDLQAVLSKYPGILNAEAVIRPFWKTEFPSDVKEITIRRNGNQ